jgi:hypothetical protein
VLLVQQPTVGAACGSKAVTIDKKSVMLGIWSVSLCSLRTVLVRRSHRFCADSGTLLAANDTNVSRILPFRTQIQCVRLHAAMTRHYYKVTRCVLPSSFVAFVAESAFNAFRAPRPLLSATI